MKLLEIINKSIYGTTGYISSEEDIDTLEQYILYNSNILKNFQNILTSTTYSEENMEFHEKIEYTWKKYFPDSIHINNGKSRGHSFGAADNDDTIFNDCKSNNISEWICKSANDVILDECILDKNIEEADFYYLNGIGYEGIVKYDFNFDRIINETFYPQTNFYIININKCNYLNDRQHVDEIYDKIKNIANYNGKAWEYGFRSCETLLSECIERNKLSKYNLVSKEKFIILLEIIKHYNIHDPSHKNIMIEGIFHYHFNNQPIIEI